MRPTLPDTLKADLRACIGVVVGVYSVDSGEVTFFEQHFSEVTAAAETAAAVGA